MSAAEPPPLAHELRNTLAAIDMHLENALDELASDDDPAGSIERARVGVDEALALIAARLERR